MIHQHICAWCVHLLEAALPVTSGWVCQGTCSKSWEVRKRCPNHPAGPDWPGLGMVGSGVVAAAINNRSRALYVFLRAAAQARQADYGEPLGPIVKPKRRCKCNGCA